MAYAREGKITASTETSESIKEKGFVFISIGDETGGFGSGFEKRWWGIVDGFGEEGKGKGRGS